jgi:catechol 2,3-dioxygenase-like lactoylglutathione lyase family enzyme
MEATGLTPILNVSSMEASFAWFERLGWRKARGWNAEDDPHAPAVFGAVASGCREIFLCLDGQGGRGHDVDAVHSRCAAEGLEVTFPPTDMPWGVRELHVCHPDGHVLRVGSASGGG